MKQSLKSFAKQKLNKLNIAITRYQYLESLEGYDNDINQMAQLPTVKLEKLLAVFNQSKSQSRQDLFVLTELDFKKNGYFVEFGATNGIDFSNSYLLEKDFGWNGILAEPAKCWHKALKENRTSNIETNCVWTDSNLTLNFNEVESAELSTISAYNSSDIHSSCRKNGNTYEVSTISLLDLLDKYNAPKEIDYLSIDTEGSEYEILRDFDFNKYTFNVITCEHNYTPMREKIFHLLTSWGYRRKYLGFSKWDDWYVR